MLLRGIKQVIFLSVISILFSTNTSHAQLNQVLGRIVNQVLIEDLTLTPGVHKNFFLEAADKANRELTPALNISIASNIAAFPLSSATVTTFTFEIFEGRPVSAIKSLGPIFAETAETLGKGKINIGFNNTYLNLAKFRGIPTEDIRFTFIHTDVGEEGLGDIPFEHDTVDWFPDIDVNANILALFATVGVTNNLDIGVAIPIVNVSLRGEAKAVINSVTLDVLGEAAHRFNADGFNPILEDIIPYDESAFGLGDIAFRFKYNFLRKWDLVTAVLIDIRVPTGDEKNFLGTGKTNIRFSYIISKRLGNFTPHLNLGFDRRSANLDSDELEFIVGFDQRIVSGVNFAAELMGEVDINDREALVLLPGSATIGPLPGGPNGQIVDLSNIPERDNDNSLNASFGIRVAASERFLFLGNVLVPLNGGGLRSTFVPTVGLTLSF